MEKWDKQIVLDNYISGCDILFISFIQITGATMKKQDISLKFLDLIRNTYRNRLMITVITMLTFLGIVLGVAYGTFSNSAVSQEWKEILLLILGAFIASYQKIIDFWFNNDKQDAELIERTDEDDNKKDNVLLG